MLFTSWHFLPPPLLRSGLSVDLINMVIHEFETRAFDDMCALAENGN